MGNAGKLRPHRREFVEEAQLTPHGKRASAAESNILLLQRKYLRAGFKKNINELLNL
ncbi:hypothetical protein GCM10007380_06000 [Gottfriedia solisilvae]|uniref:Uncharacterized protein n=1 Tax=Gottfriedia solisilvae TaxID=1516104 RepID=A0A8J3AJ11_9BACI|nr:hypothetical protein GCM10007380_06000 [Gottfriedia solisilvae]